MIQQINLYQDILKQNQTKPVINRYFYALSGAILLLIGCSIYLASDLNSTKKTLQQARQQLGDSELRIQLLKAKFPNRQLNPLLEQEILQTQNMLISLSKVIDLLTDNKSDLTQGYSRYFTALARQGIADVWLSNIIMVGEYNSLKLQGSTYKAEKIPVFLQKLNNESVFQGRSFAKLIMTQAKEDEDMIDFTVSTTTEDLEKDDHD